MISLLAFYLKIDPYERLLKGSIQVDKAIIQSIQDVLDIETSPDFIKWLNVKGQFSEKNGFSKEIVDYINFNNIEII